jgi:hypothetical protein
LVADLSEADRAAVRSLALAVYPPEEWADWPGQHIEWSPLEWCVRVHGDDALVSYVGVGTREAEYAGQTVRIGAIGGVKTHPTRRRQGFASLGLRRAVAFFHEQSDVKFALLVCTPGLIGYYGRFGWGEFTGRLLVRQRGVGVEFTFNRVLTLGVRSEAPVVGVIDLLGPPW